MEVTGAQLYEFWCKKCEGKAPDGSVLPPFERIDKVYQEAWESLAKSDFVARAVPDHPPDGG